MTEVEKLRKENAKLKELIWDLREAYFWEKYKQSLDINEKLFSDKVLAVYENLVTKTME